MDGASNTGEAGPHEGETEATEAVFEVASEMLSSLPPEDTTDTQKLRFYGLLQQATVGPCSRPAPPMHDLRNRAKWNAWRQCYAMGTADARQHYVDCLFEVLRGKAPDRAADLRRRIDSVKRAGGAAAVAEAAAPPNGHAAADFTTPIRGGDFTTPIRGGGGDRGPLLSSTPRKPATPDELVGLRMIAAQGGAAAAAAADTSRIIAADDSVASAEGEQQQQQQEEEGLGRGEGGAPAPAQVARAGAAGDAAAQATGSIDEVIAEIQAELHNTTNRVRELEFQARVPPPQHQLQQSTGFTPGQLALILLWPVAVQAAWTYMRPRRPGGRQ